MTLAANTITPRPPLNIFDVTRKELQGSDWFTLLTVPSYWIPKNGPVAGRGVNTACIMTGLTISNIHTGTIQVSAQVVGQDGHAYYVLKNAPVPANDYISIGFERQLMLSGEELRVSVPSNAGSANHAVAHFSYIVNQREEFEDQTALYLP